MLTSHAARFGLPEAGTSTQCRLVIGDSLPSIECTDLDGITGRDALQGESRYARKAVHPKPSLQTR